MARSAREVKGYAILPITLTPVATFETARAIQHILYIRPHAPKIPTPDTPRSLFVANVPIDATLTHFRALFADQLGSTRVERVEFESVHPSSKHGPGAAQAIGVASRASRHRKRKRGADDGEVPSMLPDTWDRELQSSGSSAVVVFVDRSSMDLAFAAVRKAAKAGRAVHWGGDSVEAKLPALGSIRYKSHQALRYPPPSQLQSIVDTFMTAYASREESLSRTRTRQRSVPDADGFITVTRGGRTGPARAEEAREKMVKMKEKEEKKRREMESSGFYRFQVREAKKREAKELIGKFEGDRKRVEEMSKHRKRVRPD